MLGEMSMSTCQLMRGRVGLDKFTGYLSHMPGQAENMSQHPDSKLQTHSRYKSNNCKKKAGDKMLWQFLAGARNLLNDLPKLDSVGAILNLCMFIQGNGRIRKLITPVFTSLMPWILGGVRPSSLILVPQQEIHRT